MTLRFAAWARWIGGFAFLKPRLRDASTGHIHEVCNRAAELLGKHEQDIDRGVAKSALDLGEVAEGDPFNLLLGKPSQVPGVADVAPDQNTKTLGLHVPRVSIDATGNPSTIVAAIMNRSGIPDGEVSHRRGTVALLAVLAVVSLPGCNRGRDTIGEATAIQKSGDTAGALAKLEEVKKVAPGTKEVAEASSLAVKWAVQEKNSNLLARVGAWDLGGQAAAELCAAYAELKDQTQLEACLKSHGEKEGFPAATKDKLNSTLLELRALPADQVLTAKPGLAIDIPREVYRRVLGYIEGDAEQACPDASDVRGTDQFEVHEKRQTTQASCRAFNEKAAPALKQCPFLAMGEVSPRYDFERSELVLAFSPQRYFLTTVEGRIWFNRDVLLHWPGLLPDRAKEHRKLRDDLMCIGGWESNNTGMSNASLDLKMPPAEAKSLIETLRTGRPAIEVAAVLDGGAKEESFPCEAIIPRTATGQVLAWRLVVLSNLLTTRIKELPWHSVRDWNPPSDCSVAREILGAPKSDPSSEEAAAPRSSEGAFPGPTESAWASAPESTVTGSSALRCETKVLDGYFRAVCAANELGKPSAVSFVSEESPMSAAKLDGGNLVLVHPYREGVRFEAKFTWGSTSQKLLVDWKEGSARPFTTGSFAPAP